MTRTPTLGLTPLEAAQAQKHVTVNEALARIDAGAQLAVLDRDRSAPPTDPADGARYLVASGASDAWTGREGEIAAWDAAAAGWLFLTPKEGWRLWIEDEAALMLFRNGGWTPVAGAGVFNPVEGGLLGVNAAADAANRLTVASEAVLMTHAGAGVQVKLNKNAPADTASLLFQTGWSGRAEIGLVGDDALRVKVSPDGGTFHEAMVVDSATGAVSFPNTPVPIPQTIQGVSGNLPVGAGVVNIVTPIIQNDAVFTINLPTQNPMLVFISYHRNCAMLLARSTTAGGTSYVIPAAVAGTEIVAGANGPYDGTTGAAGKMTVAVDGDGTAYRLYIENRVGGARIVSVTWFG